MSEDADQEAKTENASERRLADAFEKGNTPFSREAVVLGSMLGMSLAMALSVAAAGRALTSQLHIVFDHVADVDLENANEFGAQILGLVKNVFKTLLPVWALVAAGGMIGALAQNVPNASLERLRPKMERLSPSSNIKRMLGQEALLELAKSLAKVVAIGALLYHLVKTGMLKNTLVVAENVEGLPMQLLYAAQSLLGPLALLALVIAIADILFTRTKWHTQMKMTRQEVKDEVKQSEGDPHLRGRIKAMGRQRAKTRMMNDLPRATMVVVNPTHYAVALRYVPDENAAPLVIAKGLDHLALKIKSFCEQNEIEIIESPGLARGLYAACEMGTMIPAEFFQAVAEIIHFIEMRNRLRTRHVRQG